MKRRSNIILPAIWTAVIFVLATSFFGSRTTEPVISRILNEFLPQLANYAEYINYIIRKMAHVAVYSVLAALWYRGLVLEGVRPLRAAEIAVLLSILCASGDELFQATQGRTSLPKDVLLDSLSAMLGVLVFRRAADAASRKTAP
ncbi:MAG TPA: VanZ family protein [Nitrospirota bacterium]